MRGGDRYPVIVRKTEPKPIRIFLQDGCNDQFMTLGEIGDWWLSNLALSRALENAGYDTKHAWGTGRHSGVHAAAIFPDVMRWLWRDWQEPIKTQPEKNFNSALQQILKPGETWTVASEKINKPCDLTSDPQGNVYCRNENDGKIYRLEMDGNITEIARQPGKGGSIAFDSKGKLYAADKEAGTISFRTEPGAESNAESDKGKWETFVDGLRASQFQVCADGNLYATESSTGKVWRVAPDKNKTVLAEGLREPTGIALMSDGLWMAAVESRSHEGYSLRGRSNGSFEIGQQYYWYHVPDTADDLGSGICCFDELHQLYTATRMGIMVHARDGVPRAILPLPGPEGIVEATGLCFGGEKNDVLYAICNGTIYKRSLNIKGVPRPN
jgi:sugar lactone lactonase YvrE